MAIGSVGRDACKNLFMTKTGSQQSKHMQGKWLSLDVSGGVLVLQGVLGLQGVVGNQGDVQCVVCL